MKHASSYRTKKTALFLLLALPAACHPHPRVVPVFQESETNDTPATADYFGVLERGDRLVIEGVIGDPFLDIDGFAFTSASPIHVDFQLFADRDLDVCLYDPFIDRTVACFATADDPERGGVDVLAGGLDFHLTVEACIEPGCFPAPGTPYTLELSVHALFLTAEGSETKNLDRGATSPPTVLGTDARTSPERTIPPAASRRYKRDADEKTSAVTRILEERVEILHDEETGSTTLFLTWRGWSADANGTRDE